MAITLVGSPVEAENHAGGTITLTLPAGTTTNDVVYVVHSNSALATTTLGMSTTGYTLVASVPHNNATGSLEVHRKVMGGTPDTTAVVNSDGGAGATGNAAVLFVLRGVDTTTPEDATATTAFGSSTNPDPPSITTVTAAAWVLACASARNSDTAVTAPAGYSNQVDINSVGSGTACTCGSSTLEKTAAGAENPAAWTAWNTGTWGAISVAVRPQLMMGQIVM